MHEPALYRQLLSLEETYESECMRRHVISVKNMFSPSAAYHPSGHEMVYRWSRITRDDSHVRTPRRRQTLGPHTCTKYATGTVLLKDKLARGHFR